MKEKGYKDRKGNEGGDVKIMRKRKGEKERAEERKQVRRRKEEIRTLK